MFRTGDERKRKEKSVGIGKSSHFLKVLTMDLLGIWQALCFRTHNELTMGLLGKCPLAPSVGSFATDAVHCSTRDSKP